MISLIFFVTCVTSYKYSWTLDKLNSLSHIPDFFISYRNDKTVKITSNVYVVDSGISYSKDFYDNIYTEENMINDVKEDQMGHGTFVTSQISSKYYGVTSNVNITSIKVFGKEDDPSSSKELIDALNYIRTDCKKTTNNCVINLSLGLDNKHKETDDLLEVLHNENMLIIAAAGNDNQNCYKFTPSHLPFLLVVGSINYLDIKSSFTNYGDCVDIYTYGELVPGITLNDKTSISSGTSMAAPIITGYIADYWNNYPELTNKQIQEKFLQNYSVNKYGNNMFVLKNSYLNDFVVIFFSIIIIGLFYSLLKIVSN